MHVGLIIGAIVAGVVAIIWVAHVMEKKRTAELEAVATDLGLDFIDKPGKDFASTFGKMYLFNQGHSRTATNVMQGEANGVAIAIFGYRYTTGGGKHQHTHSQTVISFQSEHLDVPEFELRPEKVFHKIGFVFGYKDIDFDSHPVFSKQYLLRGPNEDAIRDLFDAARLEFFEDFGRNRVGVEAKGNRLIFYRPDKRVKPEQIRDLLEEGFHVYSQFKTKSG